MKKLILILSLFTSFTAHANPLPSAAHIYVEGSSEIAVTPDKVVISIGIESVDMDVQVAKKELDSKTGKVVKKALALSVAKEKITADSLLVSRETGWENGKNIYKGTKVSRNIRVELNDVEKYNDILSSLINLKVSEDISSKLSLENEDKYTDLALSAALEDAKNRATMLAKIQGKSIKDVYSISEFNLRLIERQHLNLSRKVVGTHVPVDAEDIGVSSDANIASALSRVTGVSLFEPGTMVAKAQVFVVYLIK